MTRRSRTRLVVWTVSALSAGMLAISVAIALEMPAGVDLLGIGASVSMIWNASLFALVGAIIVLRKDGHLVGWLFLLAGLGWSGYVLGSTYAEYSLAFPRRDLPAEDLVIWTSSWTPLVAIGCVPALLLFVFPSGRLAGRRWRRPALVAVMAAAAGVVGSALAPGPYQDFPSIANPFPASGQIGRAMFFLKEIAWPVLIVTFIVGARSVRERARAGSETERLQVKWLALSGFGMAILAIGWGVSFLLGSHDAVQGISGAVVSTLPLSVGVAMLKHRLYDIDVILNRALVYSALTGIIAATYLASVVVLQLLLEPITRESDLAVAASTLGVAALFRPLRSAVQGFIDRRFYRRRYDAAETLAAFASRLRDQVDLLALRNELLVAVVTTFQPTHASVWLRPTRPKGAPR